MPELVMLILDDDAKARQVSEAWLKAGVPGLTVVDSLGLAQPEDQLGLPDDLPLFPSLRHWLHPRGKRNRTLIAAVPDGFDVEALAAATEAVTGLLDESNQGILLVVPVRRVWGMRQKEAYGAIPAS
jgi:hypothetical protein